MQDNEPLMKALSRLIIVNQPDLIVFVGEALVGNDAVDQLRKFNQALVDLSPKDNIREIDGILLTKFDTVDEKGNLVHIFNALMQFISWCSYFNDLCNRETRTILWCWTKIYSSQEIKY